MLADPEKRPVEAIGDDFSPVPIPKWLLLKPACRLSIIVGTTHPPSPSPDTVTRGRGGRTIIGFRVTRPIFGSHTTNNGVTVAPTVPQFAPGPSNAIRAERLEAVGAENFATVPFTGPQFAAGPSNAIRAERLEDVGAEKGPTVPPSVPQFVAGPHAIAAGLLNPPRAVFLPGTVPSTTRGSAIPLVSDTTAALMDTPEPAVTVPVPEEAVEVFNTRYDNHNTKQYSDDIANVFEHYGNYNDVSEQSANNDVDLEQHRIGSYGRLNGANVFE
ncbi:unnamed protein product, partial [Mesorhabditis spiculigera]